MANIDISGGMGLSEINRRQKLARALSQQSLQSKPQTEFQALAAVLAGGLNEYSANKLEKQKPEAIKRLAAAIDGGKMDLETLSNELGPEVALPLMMAQRKMEYEAGKPKLTVATDAAGNPIIVDKTSGEYSFAQPAGNTAQAAPVQTEGIQTNDLPPMPGTQPPAAPSGNIDDLLRQQLEAGGFAPPGGFGQPGSPQLPAQIPDTGLPPGTPQMTPIPRPQPTGNPRADQKALEEWNKLRITQPLKDRDRLLNIEDKKQDVRDNPQDIVSKANTFAMRMQKSSGDLLTKDGKNLDSVLAGVGDSAAGAVPLAGNYLVSPEYQKAKQAAGNWIRANLRKESGAVIGEEEMKAEYRNYFPVPGDSDQTIKQKRELRAIAERGMQQAAGSLWQGGQAQQPSAPASDGWGIRRLD